MEQQGFIQLPTQGQQGQQRPQVPQQPQFQGGFPNVNQAGPTPPPHPPMGQMPYVRPGGHPHQGADTPGTLSGPSPFGQPERFGLPSTGLHNTTRPYSLQQRSSNRSRPIVHNALERRSQPKTEVYDLRAQVTSEKEARDALSTYLVCSIKKDGSASGFDDSGVFIKPTWERAKHTQDTGVSQDEAYRSIIELQMETEPVSVKKAKLVQVIQEQLEHSQDLIEEQEEDPTNFCCQLVQFHQSIKRVEVSPHLIEQYEDGHRPHSNRRSHSRDRYSSKDKKKREKYKRGFYFHESPRSRRNKPKTQRQTDSITAYYKRVPREGVNCLQMWEDLQDRVDDRNSSDPYSRHSTQRPPGGAGHHLPHHLAGRQNHEYMGQHQANNMSMGGPQGHHGFLSQGHHGMHQQAGSTGQQQFGQQGQPGLAQHPHMPQGQQGFQQQGPHNQQQWQGSFNQQQGPHNQQGFQPQGPQNQQSFPQQTQYAQGPGQGQRNFAQQQQGGPQRVDPRGQHGHPGMPQGAGRGQPPQANRFHPGQQQGQMGRGNAPMQGGPRPTEQRPGNAHQRPPPPPTHGQPTVRGGPKPRVVPMSPRDSRSSFADSDDESGSDSGSDTPASSVGSSGRRKPRQEHRRGRTRSRSHDPKVFNIPSREHSRVGRQRNRSVSPPDFRPRSAMRNTSRPAAGRHVPWQNDFGRSSPRHTTRDFDRPDSFDREMLRRAMTGDFAPRTAPRRAYSDGMDHMPHMPRRATASDFDRTRRNTGRPRMYSFDEPRVSRDSMEQDFRRVSPATARRSMFDEDIDIMSDNFDAMHLSKGYGGGGHRGFMGQDRFERGLRDRFRRDREYYEDGEDDDDDDWKRTRFADQGPGRQYGRPTGRTFVNESAHPFGARRARPMYDI